MIGKPEWAEVFRDLEKEAVHPSAQEIAEAYEGVGSEFTRAEIRAHASWCDRCQEIARDFESFAATLPLASPRPAVARRSVRTVRPWLAAAAGFAACALPTGLWWSLRPTPPPIFVEKRVEVPAPAPVLQAASAAVVDLMPAGTQLRGPVEATGGRRAPWPGIVTFILNDADALPAEATAEVRNAGGKTLWSGRLRRENGVFVLAVAGEVLGAGPITIELSASGRRIVYQAKH